MPRRPENRPPAATPVWTLACAALVAALLPPSLAAAPYKPAADEVVERLPERLGAAEEDAMARLRARLRAAPRDAAAAAELAERHYRIAQRQGDPRHVGYAQAILAPWQGDPAPPADVRLVRAQLAQFVHDFPAARAELAAVLAADPGHPVALAYRAILHLVAGDYAAGRADCAALARRAGGLVVEACGPTADALSGRAEAAYRALSASLARHPAAPPNERLWVLTRLGEVAARLGRPAAAEAHFKAALGLGVVDQYLLATYAEFLLDAGRPADAAALLAPHAANDVLLLRLALAEQAAGLAGAADHARQLAARFDANRRRGDKTHLADEAWFALRFGGDARAALRLAAENWALEQREPGDARIFLEAAQAAGDAAAAEPVRRWLAESAIEDLRLRPLAQALFGAAGAAR